MRKLILYVATSLDGYIADLDGGVDWLLHDQDYGYTAFTESVDCLVMGSKTYLQCLEFGDWAFGQMQTYVLSHSLPPASDPSIHIGPHKIADLLTKLKGEEAEGKKEGKNIWLFGGAEVISQALEADLVDEFYLYRQAIILGEGIPLFKPSHKRHQLKLQEVRGYDSGMILQRYSRI